MHMTYFAFQNQLRQEKGLLIVKDCYTKEIE